ncbi:MAG: extracellular solute-binding protein [Actinomycetaceae bacterium]|nr:extracellular solute-binding protein [Actinomycetaceae bacterium]
MFHKRPVALASLALVPALALVGCSSQGGRSSGDGPLEITLWTHSAGNEGEMEVVTQIIDDFNASQDDYKVVRQDFPQDAYNDSVQGAAASGDLPCIMDVDAPVMPSWANNGWLVPSGLTEEDTADFLPSTVGTYDGEIYSIGFWDVNTVLFTRASVLEANDIRVPTVDEPWTADEFAEAEEKIQASGEFDYVIDWGTGSSGEWWPYAYSPLLQSFGGDLIDRSDYSTADGVLNGPEAQEFGAWFQDQFTQGYASKSGAQDRTEFKDGKVAMHYDGIWEYAEGYEAYGDDLVVAPLPDFGNGSKAGVGSWQTGLSQACTAEQKEGGLAYLKFAMKDEYIAQFSDVTSLIPATDAAAELTTKGYYGEGKPLQIAQEVSDKYGEVRPVTPAYPVVSSVFEKGLQDIMNGSDVKSTEDQMVVEIDADIESAGYNN